MTRILIKFWWLFIRNLETYFHYLGIIFLWSSTCGKSTSANRETRTSCSEGVWFSSRRASGCSHQVYFKWYQYMMAQRMFTSWHYIHALWQSDLMAGTKQLNWRVSGWLEIQGVWIECLVWSSCHYFSYPVPILTDTNTNKFTCINWVFGNWQVLCQTCNRRWIFMICIIACIDNSQLRYNY